MSLLYIKLADIPKSQVGWSRRLGILLFSALMYAGYAVAAEPAGNATSGDEAHKGHQMMLKTVTYKRTLQEYPFPDITVVTMQGDKVSVADQLNSQHPVLLNFIFATCPTICPVLSATFSSVQAKLDPTVRMISISIDPEHDTPEQLRAYAKRFKAGAQWQFLTGRLDDIIAIQKAFDIYRGNKMSHEPVTFLRKSSDQPWIRLEGFATAADVVAEYRQMVAQ